MSKKRKVLHRGLALMLAVVMSLGTCLTALPVRVTVTVIQK